MVKRLLALHAFRAFNSLMGQEVTVNSLSKLYQSKKREQCAVRI